MSGETRQILNMLAEGKINVSEAEKLLEATHESGTKGAEEGSTSGQKPKYLKIMVEPKDQRADKRERINIRIPLQVIRAGARLGSMLPEGAREKVHHALHDKGIDLDLNNIKSESLDNILESLSELSIDVDDKDERVRIYCE